MKIVFYPRFERSYNRLDPQIRKVADAKVALFLHDPFNKRLRTHQLQGKLKNIWSFSVDARHRILFVFLDVKHESAALIDIGTHRLYS